MNSNDFYLILTLKHSIGLGSDNIHSQTKKLKILKSNKQITQAQLYTFIQGQLLDDRGEIHLGVELITNSKPLHH